MCTLENLAYSVCVYLSYGNAQNITNVEQYIDIHGQTVHRSKAIDTRGNRQIEERQPDKYKNDNQKNTRTTIRQIQEQQQDTYKDDNQTNTRTTMKQIQGPQPDKYKNDNQTNTITTTRQTNQQSDTDTKIDKKPAGSSETVPLKDVPKTKTNFSYCTERFIEKFNFQKKMFISLLLQVKIMISFK